MNLNPASVLMISSSMVTLFLASYTWKRRTGSTNTTLFYLLLAITVWSLFYGLEVAATSMVLIQIIGTIEYTGIASVPVLWLIFAVSYTKYNSWLTTPRIILLFIVPALSVVMFSTNHIHCLFYSSFTFSCSDGYWFQQTTPGPFFWVHIAYSYLAVFLGLLLLVRMYFKVERTSRLNILFFIVGALLPYVVNIAYVTGFKPFGFMDLTPLGFICMGVLLTVGIFSVNLFNISPLALDVLFDNIPDAIFVVDNDGKIVSANPSARVLLKMKIVSRKEARLRRHRAVYPSVIVGTTNDKTEVEINERIYFKTVNAIVDSKGEKSGTLLVLRDITELKNTEEALKEREQQLRETNATKDKFFSIIAHDLRSPFNSILGFSGILTEQIRQKDYSQAGEYSEIIQDSAQRAVYLLNNLMEWSSSQTGRMDFNPEDVAIGPLIDEVIDLLGDTAVRKSITISKSVPENIIIRADKHMISSVLRNLISNAIKFSLKTGVIVITAGRNDNEVQVSVADNGVGMTKEALGKLFRIESCLSTTGTANEKGSGLGLLLCKEFVERHGGKIWAESESGKGSIFYFTVP